MNFAGVCVKFLARHRLALVAAFALVGAFATFFVLRGSFEENIYALLPTDDRTAQSHLAAAKTFKQSDTLWFSISGDGARAAVSRLSEALSKTGDFSDAAGDVLSSFPTPSELASAFPIMFSERDVLKLDALSSDKKIRERFLFFKRKLVSPEGSFFKETMLSDPSGSFSLLYEKIARASENFGSAKISDGAISDGSGVNFLVAARGKYDAADSAKSAEIVGRVDAVIEEMSKEFPNTKIAYAGGYRIAAENAAAARLDSSRCFLATLVLVVVLCFAAFSNRVFAPLALVPSVFGSAVAFCAMSVVCAKISAIAAAFASIAVGVGIDYAVHILYRLDGRGKVSVSAAAETADILARPIAVVSGTTIAAFAIIWLGSDGGLAQLGFFGAVGVAFSAVASVFVLPALAVGLGSRRRTRVFDALAEKVSSLAERNPRGAFAVVAVFSIAALPFAVRVGFDGDMSSMGAMSERAAADSLVISEIWGKTVSRPFVSVRANTLESALDEAARVEKFLSSKQGVSVFPATEILPSKSVREANLARWKNYWNCERKARLAESIEKIAAGLDFKKEPFLRAVSRLGNESETEDFAKKISERLLAARVWESPNGAAVAVFVRTDNPAKLAREVAAFSPYADYIDMKFFGAHIADSSRSKLLKFAFAAFAAAACWLLFLTRSAKFALGVFVPVVAGMLWSFGVLGALGININMVNSAFAVFAVCVAQDYCAFILMSRMRGERARTPAAAVFVSALTTAFAFGTLAFASHPMLRGLGMASSVSILSILCATVLISNSFPRFGGRANAAKS